MKIALLILTLLTSSIAFANEELKEDRHTVGVFYTHGRNGKADPNHWGSFKNLAEKAPGVAIQYQYHLENKLWITATGSFVTKMGLVGLAYDFTYFKIHSGFGYGIRNVYVEGEEDTVEQVLHSSKPDYGAVFSAGIESPSYKSFSVGAHLYSNETFSIGLNYRF